MKRTVQSFYMTGWDDVEREDERTSVLGMDYSNAVVRPREEYLDDVCQHRRAPSMALSPFYNLD